jgi:phenylalanyl-tRNA synthetase alpha chain
MAAARTRSALRARPSNQVMDELAEIFADLGFAVATGRRSRTTGTISPRSTCPRAIRRGRCTTPSISPTGCGWPRDAAAHAYLAGADPHDADAGRRRSASSRRAASIVRDSDATHTPMFHQIEGLVIDKGIHLGHLKWTLETFLKAFFERDDIVLRLRPSYFPFTEPSVEVDVGYTMEGGKRVIGGSGDAPGGGWMEVLGSGMVNRGDRELRARSRRVAGLRLRHRRRSARHAEIRHGRPARLLRWRSALAAALRLCALDVPTLSAEE